MRKNSLLVFSSMILLSSCTVGPDYRAPGFLPEKQIADSLGLKDTTGRVIPSDWYRQFNDQTLNYLIACGLRDSPNVAAAIRRLREARASLNIAKADYLPVLNASGAFKYDKPGKNIGYELKNNYYQTGLDASWELDTWGGGRRQSEAAQALFKAAAADLDNVRVSLVAEIADTYIGLRTAQEQLRISRENLRLQQDIAELVAEKYRAGLTDDIALNQAYYAVETTQSLIPALEQQISASSNALAILTGVLPGHLSVKLEPVTDNLVSRRFDFDIDAMFNIPSRVVRARPDVRAAEQEIRVNRQNWLPQLQVGYRRNTALSEASNGFIVGASFPLFSNRYKSRIANARHTASQYQFNQVQIETEARIRTKYDEMMRLLKALGIYDVSLMEETLEMLGKAVEAGQLSVIEYYTEADSIYSKLLSLSEMENTYQKLLADIYRNSL